MNIAWRKMNTMKIKKFSGIHVPWKRNMNKKGFPLADTGMFFLCWFIIIVCIVTAIVIFFLYRADVRNIEAKLLAEKLIKTVIDEQGFNQEILGDDFNLLDKTELDRQIINNGDFYVQIEVFENDELLKRYKNGTRDFSIYCELVGEKLPKCYQKKFFIDNYKINILTASNQR